MSRKGLSCTRLRYAAAQLQQPFGAASEALLLCSVPAASLAVLWLPQRLLYMPRHSAAHTALSTTAALACCCKLGQSCACCCCCLRVLLLFNNRLMPIGPVGTRS
jgi:hypothetical protein